MCSTNLYESMGRGNSLAVIRETYLETRVFLLFLFLFLNQGSQILLSWTLLALKKCHRHSTPQPHAQLTQSYLKLSLSCLME